MIISYKNLVDLEKVELQDELDVRHLFADRNDIQSVERLRVRLQAKWLSNVQTVHVDGICTTRIEFVCSRCLRHFTEPLEIPYHEMFSKDEGWVNQDDEGRIHLVEGEHIDLLPTIEENLILALPFIPVCKEDCQGLCPVCGQNQNERSCQCKQDDIDPRLEGLKAFFE